MTNVTDVVDTQSLNFKIEQIINKIYKNNDNHEFLSLGCVTMDSTIRTNSGIKLAIEKAYTGTFKVLCGMEKFKALGSWQKDNVAEYKNISLPYNFPDVSVITSVGVCFIMKEKHLTTCIVILYGTGIFNYYETSISLV